MRLIDADNFKQIDFLGGAHLYGETFLDGVQYVLKLISNALTVDAVEVVRCKKCKHYTNYENYTYKKLNFWWCNKFDNITKSDDFCSYGERKEND